MTDLALAAAPAVLGPLPPPGVPVDLDDMGAAKRPGLTRMGAMRRLEPAKWAREIRRAMKASGGRVPEAAESLDVSTRTLQVWLEDPQFADVPRARPGRRAKADRK